MLLNFAVYHTYEDRGLLHLPVCPIYGFGGLLLLLCFHRAGANSSALTVFGLSALITTGLELAASYPLERMGFRPWDYSAWPLHFEWRISLVSSLIFGLLALAIVKGIHPLLRRLYEKAPAWLMIALGGIPVLVMLADAVQVFIL